MTEALELEPSLSDGDLARAAADGDRDALAEIYDRFADRLYDFCVGLIGDRDAAADCVQDAFCVAATDLGGLREPDKIRPWLYSIARHQAMRRLRHRYREEVSDELPDMVSHEASPETLAGQSELARLVAEAAGGLSDRDRELLNLSYRHGLDGPEIAETLGVTLSSANTMVFRLRQTVERCLGALLVARGAQGNPDACTDLAAILNGWDGQFTVLMRKRMARHIDSCHTCKQDQRRQVNPVALLGGAPVFIPAPAWLRRQTLDRVELTCASSNMTATQPGADSSMTGTAEHPNFLRQIKKGRLAFIVGIPLLFLGVPIPWFTPQEDPASRVIDTGAESSEGPLPVTPATVNGPPAVNGPPTPDRPQSALPSGAARPPMPAWQEAATGSADTPTQAPGATNPAPIPMNSPASPGPNLAPAPGGVDSAAPNTDPKIIAPTPQIDLAPADTGPVVTGPVVTGPVMNPNDVTIDSQVSIAPIDPNLNPKSISTFPQPNTATITIPNATSPNLQIGTVPKLNGGTGTNTGASTGKNTNTTTSTGKTTNTGTGTGTGTCTGTGTGKNTNTSTDSKDTKSGST